MASKGKKRTYVWRVTHPDHTTAVVMADNWEQATVRAAEWWDVPWGTVVAYCEKEKKEELLVLGMCCECNAKLWADGGTRIRCPICEAKARDRELSRKYQNRRFYSDMHRK